MAYALIAVLSIITLYFIGLAPARTLLSSKTIGESGLFIMFISWVVWIFAMIASLGMYWLVHKLAKFKNIRVWVIVLISLGINIIGMFSVFPGLALVSSLSRNMQKSQYQLEMKIISEDMTQSGGKYTYLYQISIDNQSGKALTSKGTWVSLGVSTPGKMISFYPLSSALDIDYKRYDFPPGETIISGKSDLQFTSKEVLLTGRYPVKVHVKVAVTDTLDIEKYLDSTIPGIQDLIYSEINNSSMPKSSNNIE